ncbi:MaoC/PaaZ C-terminal domain-containing protein [Aquamicrobium sp. LC103]|uniref:MaoC/PaaZ C-terminal domain-containing protein n=1 Tax=Aquamicrobium sp. LC103 TaxID=1120658 RepID=UPI00063E8F55|nr:MaoC/PaaZ C-terminal domain-containing protein [Aquamicrobium sp. LC103]TKT74491.1 MaoC family protein [Aquamicrobium sp. LC103]
MIDPRELLRLDIPVTEQRWDERDCALYALGVGLGADPLDGRQLSFLDERRMIVAAPTMATVLAYKGFWIEQVPAGVEVAGVLHAEQRLELHRPLPCRGYALRKTRPTGVVDRGDRGAHIFIRETIEHAEDGGPLATLSSRIVSRGDGGCGSTREAPGRRRAVPDRVPDLTFEVPTLPQQALLYRLSGDHNPLHLDPTFARGAGFGRPILHGLGTFGMVGMALLGRLCDFRSERFRSLDVRFSAVVFPGETLEVSVWSTGEGEAMFSAGVAGRGAVLDAGVFGFAP